MKNRMLLWAVLAATAFSQTPPRFSYTGLRSKQILSSGPSAQKIDLVIVADGYNAADISRGTFEKDARAAMNELWQVEPYRELRNRFNVHIVPVVSFNDSRLPNGNAPHLYALGTEVDPRRGTITSKRRQEMLQAAHNAPDVDGVIVLTTVSGRSTGGTIYDQGRQLPNPILSIQDYSVLAHELGHSIGQLGDEYDSSSSLADRDATNLNPKQDLSYPNLTQSQFIDAKNRDSIQRTAKWKHFLALPNSYPLISAYQGGFYRQMDVWRPSYRCRMGDRNAPFCPVCHEELTRRILEACAERFDDASYHRAHPLGSWK